MLTALYSTKVWLLASKFGKWNAILSKCYLCLPYIFDNESISEVGGSSDFSHELRTWPASYNPVISAPVNPDRLANRSLAGFTLVPKLWVITHIPLLPRLLLEEQGMWDIVLSETLINLWLMKNLASEKTPSNNSPHLGLVIFSTAIAPPLILSILEIL